MPKLIKKLRVMNPMGLHARPASIFVKIACKYESNITVCKDEERVNGKSMMGILTLAAEQGAELELEVDGLDAVKAMAELEEFLLTTEEPRDHPGIPR